MHFFVANFMAGVLLLATLVSWAPIVEAATKSSSCENGECIPKLIDKLEDTSALYKKQCLPKGIKDKDIEKYHLDNGLSESCWKYITEINHLESQLLSHQNKLESKLGCESGNCKLNSSGDSLNAQIKQLSSVENNLSCTAPKKAAIKRQCPSDLTCVLASTALGMGGYLAELVVPAKAKPKNCHLGNDSCLTQLATGFLKSAFTFFEGAWDLLKIIGKKTKQKMTQFWNWVSGAEDHSSTSQLAMAKASEEPGVFSMLMNDFPGTMKKIWEALVGSLKEWMKTKVFCQKWSGVPQFSQCLKPTESFDCISCKAIVTGMCSLTGTIVAEIVPAFLTGGLVTAAKNGVNGAAKIAKLFKVSSSGLKAAKASRVGKVAIEASTKVDDVLRISKGLQAAKFAVSASLKAIKTYLLSPTRKLVKTSYIVLSNAVKKGGTYLAVTPVGKTLIFSGKSIKLTAKVILYPIDNPMTTMAYKSGVRSFEKLFQLGSPKLARTTAITSSIIKVNPKIESTVAKLELAKTTRPLDPEEVIKLERKLYDELGPQRESILRSALGQEDATISDVIHNLYPELQYSDFARTLPKQSVLKSENDLFIEIQRLPAGAKKEKLLSQYKAHTAQGEMRARVLGDEKTPFEHKISPEKTHAQENFNHPLPAEKIAIKKSISDYMDSTQDELLKAGALTERKIKASKNPVVYDVIAIGAGPNNAAAVSVIKETNPALKVLVVEATEDMGTFNKLKGFDINTPEFIGNSGNTIPGSPLQLRDYNITDASFASADDLGHLTVGTYKAADSDMIFNNKVIRWEKEPKPGAWPGKYRVETSNGVVVYANSGLAGTGFGPPITKLKDPASIKLVSKYENETKNIDLLVDKNFAPKIISVDDFLTIAAKDMKHSGEAMARYKNQKVLVIGQGDGGNIAVEATAGLNKQLNPNGLKTDIETIWLGQEAKNGDEYLSAMGTRKQLRYSRIAEGIDDGRIETVNGYLSRIEEFKNTTGKTQFRAFYTSKEGAAVGEPLVVDHLVFATGYPNNHSTLTPIFKSIAKNGDVAGDEIVFEPVMGRVDDYTRYEEFKVSSEITKRLTINGKPEDIYATGVFAKPPVTDAEWKVPTGGFLDITAAKAAATGKMVAQKLGPQKLNRLQVETFLKVKTGEKIEFIKRPLRTTILKPEITNTYVADIHTKIELAKSLRNFKTVSNSSFRINIHKGKNGAYVYSVSGLDRNAALDVTNALARNASLSRGIDGQFELGRTALDIQVKARASGAISMENMIFTPQMLKIISPIVVPMNFTRGYNVYMSPSIKTIKANEDSKKAKKE